MTQNILNLFNIRQELVVFLRNADIIAVGTRGVATTTDSGTWSSDTSHLIAVTNIKNIRSITVDAAPLAFGTDYTVDYYFLDTTIKTKITLNAAQSGDFVITYDFGTDKIWPDFPRDDLSISSYPRIAVDILSVGSTAFGIGGNEDISNILFTVVVYGQEIKEINNYLTAVRTAFLESRSAFFYLRFIKPTSIGPLLEDPTKRQEIMHQNLDFESMFNVESVT